jgi:tripartite-type tricarboxylate transporter receptor subunit TctC
MRRLADISPQRAFANSPRCPATKLANQRASLGQNSVRTDNGAAAWQRCTPLCRAARPGGGGTVSLSSAAILTDTPKSKSMMPKSRAVSSRRLGWTLPALVLALGAVAVPAQAQDFPARTVKIVVPFPAGGTADVMPRIIADWLSRHWGQAVIIEDRTGAGGNVGAEVAAKSDPDGYTLLASPPGPFVINQNLYPHLDFDPLQFVPITVIGRVPNALVVNPDKIAANTVKDFIAYAKANDGKLANATQGNGTTSHLTSEMFQMMAHVKLQNVPYRGSAPALNDLVAGSVDCMFETLPGFASVTWYALGAPPNTPAAIAEKISAAVNEALRDPDVQKRLADLSAEPVGGTPQATAAYFHDEIERWKSVITSAHVTLE